MPTGGTWKEGGTGKGSADNGRTDPKRYADGWDRIWGKKKAKEEVKEKEDLKND